MYIVFFYTGGPSAGSGPLGFCFLLCPLLRVKCLYIHVTCLYLLTGYNKIYGHGYDVLVKGAKTQWSRGYILQQEFENATQDKFKKMGFPQRFLCK